MEKLIVASANKHKIKEIAALIGDRFEVVPMADAGFDGDIDECGETFEENAFIKAKTVFDAVGLPVVSDDSGLAVKALGGAPGVRSARYAGDEHDDAKNNAKLLSELAGENDRSAEFVTCAVYYDGTRTVKAFGRVQGRIIDELRGSCGFGYDPLFFSTELGKTFGEATDEEKNSVSHRARAFKRLAELI